MSNNNEESEYLARLAPVFQHEFVKQLRHSDCAYKKLSRSYYLVSSKRPVKSAFLHSIFRIKRKFEISGFAKERINDLSIEMQDFIKKSVSKRTPFKINCSISGTQAFNTGTIGMNSKDIEVAIGAPLEAQGYKIDLSNPKYVFVLEMFDAVVVAGKVSLKNPAAISIVEKPEDISRAQLKLREAILYFKIGMSNVRNVLDLGAAPGGFSKELSTHGVKVVAVDIADLDKRLEKDPNIMHLRIKAAEINSDQLFDMITNDMNIDPVESARVMLNLSSRLNKNGFAVMTIKCPSKNVLGYIRDAKKILSAEYTGFRLQHLPHNRMEITMFMLKK
ncbi:SAM-dependent methyltransferase [Candidatus Marsarchaeota archaeon]|nr:SAM-dependent methyltransferase [Candidatus Marsarchaeota archaeon]